MACTKGGRPVMRTIPHSITRSARINNDCESLMPSALAVLLLIIK